MERLERLAGAQLPEPYRATMIANQGQAWTIRKDEPTEIHLWGIERLESVYPMFRDGFGAAETAGILPIGGWFGGGFQFGANGKGQILDLFGNPETWKVMAASLPLFLDRVASDGIEWVNDLHQ